MLDYLFESLYPYNLLHRINDMHVLFSPVDLTNFHDRQSLVQDVFSMKSKTIIFLTDLIIEKKILTERTFP